jgi:plastocyanin
MVLPRPIVLGALLVAAACSSSSTGPSGTPGANEVWLQNSNFNPSTKSVAAGTLITFTNQDGIAHNIISSAVPGGATAINSGNFASGTFTYTFSVSGSYQYYCSIHGGPGSGMHGTITVP